jgi:hypothetical protein
MLMLIFLVQVTSEAQNEVTLRRWTEVFGTVDYQQLGSYVVGITPSANLPYRAAVSTTPNGPPGGGVTMFFRIQSAADTTAQLTLPGEKVLKGDLNGDGWDDLVLSRTVAGEEAVYIYFGTSNGVDALNPLQILPEGHLNGLQPGCIGDINNDGKSDLILRAPNAPDTTKAGKAYIFLNPVNNPIANAVVVGDTIFAGLGLNCVIGDLNNDGFNDLIVRGTKQGGPQSSWYDYVNIYWGTGVNQINTTLGLQMRTVNLYFYGVACFDVNGDGRPDLLWTAADSSGLLRVNVHYGGSNFSTTPSLRLRNPGISQFGFTIANAGDMNGDGYNDIVVGAPQATITSGLVFVFSGGPKIDELFDAAVGQSMEAAFGQSVSSIGDVNGDGLSDVIVGAPHYAFFRDKGYWGVFLGDTTIQVTAVNEGGVIPRTFRLAQAYPNPFNPSTTIKYEVSSEALITIKVFDVLGREVRVLVSETKLSGEYETVFNASSLPSGIYFYRMTALPHRGLIFTETRKVLFIK